MDLNENQSNDHYVSRVHEQMLAAATEGDEAALKTLLVEWKYRVQREDLLDKCLFTAVGADQPGSVRLLLDYGAHINGVTIDTAVEANVATDVWQAMLDYGWDINSQCLVGDPVISNFVWDPSIDPRLTWFLSHGASLESHSRRHNYTPISWTAAFRPLSVVRYLFEYSNSHGDSDLVHRSNALHAAAGCKDEDRTAVLALVADELGADANAMSTFHERRGRNTLTNARPLHFAVRSGRREHIRFLLDRGARITERDVEGRTVREFAADYHSDDTEWKMVEEWFAEKGLSVPCAE